MDKVGKEKFTITASPNLPSYVAGARIKLMCVVNPDPPISFFSFFLSFLLSSSMLTSVRHIYGSVMVNGMTDMAIMRVLTKQDSSMINFSATNY